MSRMRVWSGYKAGKIRDFYRLLELSSMYLHKDREKGYRYRLSEELRWDTHQEKNEEGKDLFWLQPVPEV